MDAYENLANAIIIQAVKDYRRVRGTAAAKELEQFFLSEWFCVLTRLDGAALLGGIETPQYCDQIYATEIRIKGSLGIIAYEPAR